MWQNEKCIYFCQRAKSPMSLVGVKKRVLFQEHVSSANWVREWYEVTAKPDGSHSVTEHPASQSHCQTAQTCSQSNRPPSYSRTPYSATSVERGFRVSGIGGRLSSQWGWIIWDAFLHFSCYKHTRVVATGDGVIERGVLISYVD